MQDSVCEESIFKSIFISHSKGLRNFLYYKTGDLQRSEDLVQEAFVKLWESCASVPFAKAKPFLFKVANNLMLNQVKHDKVVLKFRQKPTSDKNIESPEFILEEKEFSDRIQQAINGLTEGQRTVFLMNRIDKKKYREIAEELNISVKAVEKRMHLALKALLKITHKI